MDDVTVDFVCVIHVDCKHLIRSDPCRVLLGGLANGVLAFAGVLVESNQIGNTWATGVLVFWLVAATLAVTLAVTLVVACLP